MERKRVAIGEAEVDVVSLFILYHISIMGGYDSHVEIGAVYTVEININQFPELLRRREVTSHSHCQFLRCTGQDRHQLPHSSISAAWVKRQVDAACAEVRGTRLLSHVLYGFLSPPIQGSRPSLT